MRKFKLLLTLLLLAAVCSFAQTTPNLGFNAPATGTQTNTWGPLINNNFYNLDSYLSGNLSIPGLHISGGLNVGGTIQSGPITSIGASTITMKLLNSLRYADQWCNTPGVYDDSCFRNAIADIVANGTVGPYGGHMGTVMATPHVYAFGTITPVIVPVGARIGFIGSYQTGVFGTVIQATANSQTLIEVDADTTEIKGFSFSAYNGITTFTNTTAIQLGTASIANFDTHVIWNWFTTNIGIRVVNSSGLDLSHNTFDSGCANGIYSNFSLGDVQAAFIQAVALRSYNQISAVYIQGNPSPSTANQVLFSNIKVDGIFDHTLNGNGAAVLYQYVYNGSIQGTFSNNVYNDIQVSQSYGVNVGPVQTFNTANIPIFTNLNTGVSLHDIIITNPGVVNSGPPISSVYVVGSVGTQLSGIQSLNTPGAASFNTYGLYVDATSTNTRLVNLQFNAQVTASFNILDTTAQFIRPILLGTTGTITGTALTATCDSGTATVTGAKTGMPVAVSSTTGADVGGAFRVSGSVTSANTVTVYVCGTGTPASLAFNVGVVQNQ